LNGVTSATYRPLNIMAPGLLLATLSWIIAVNVYSSGGPQAPPRNCSKRDYARG
jgi:hypothetical protein